MRTETLTKAFPATTRDVNSLTEAASEAVSDLTSTAASHATRVKKHIQNLADHVQGESVRHISRVRGRVTDTFTAVTDFATERPLVCIGAALALGFLIGMSRRRRTPQS